MKHLAEFSLVAICVLVIGCATQSTTAQWRQKANGLPVGTPQSRVEQVLPPTGTVLDLRSGPGAGPIAYWVDDNTLVKSRYDDGLTLAVPIVIEAKMRPKTATATSIHPTAHARHILVLVPAGSDASVKRQSLAEAERIRASLIAGADFEVTAKQHSACPSKERGGDLGSFPRGAMVKPFEDAAFSQKVGEIGPVVYTKFGYHIIQVLDRENE
jgi:parvulin-like peptidyl-prolyl isomerase